MTNCADCGEELEEGENVLCHSYDHGTLYFCGSICAGNWFAANECQSIMLGEDE
jgi:hypothetical protein